MDSAVAMAEARRAGFDCYALSFRYGQRHGAELAAARKIAAAQRAVEQRTITVDLASIGGSALTADIDVPKDRKLNQISQEIPLTYVPARNTVFLAIALGWAEVVGARDIYIGVNHVDYSGYPDCRPAFLEAFEQLAQVATQAGIGGAHFRLHAPLLQLNKAEIVRRAQALGVDLALTHSCYDPEEDERGRVLACGRCDACLLRLKGFAEVGIRDPLPYSKG